MKTPQVPAPPKPPLTGNRGPNPKSPQLNSQCVERRVAGSRDPRRVASMPLTLPPLHGPCWRVAVSDTAFS